MTDLAALAAQAVAAGPRTESFDELERAVLETLDNLKPEPRKIADAYESMQGLRAANAVLDLTEEVPNSTLATLVERCRPSSAIEDAMQKAARLHVEALEQSGLDDSVVNALKSWFEVMEVIIDARALQYRIDVRRIINNMQDATVAHVPERTLGDDPAAPLSAIQLGQALGVGDETVRQRERAGTLFSILRPGRKRGREYPAFQAWPGVAGEPLAKTLAALGPISSTSIYGFFTSPTDLLGGLTPIETLLGRLTRSRGVEPETRALLSASSAERLEAVERGAKAYAAVVAG